MNIVIPESKTLKRDGPGGGEVSEIPLANPPIPPIPDSVEEPDNKKHKVESSVEEKKGKKGKKN
jgi:hypothetical protein